MRYVSLFILFLFSFIAIKVKSQSDVIEVGDQVWMASDLKVSSFRNGEPIPKASSPKEFEDMTRDKKPCFIIHIGQFGEVYYYNQYVLEDKRQLAPKGWRIAGMNDFLNCSQYFNNEAEGFYGPNPSAELNFNTILSGKYTVDEKNGMYTANVKYEGKDSYWYMMLEKNEISKYLMSFQTEINNTKFETGYYLCGISVRCIKGEEYVEKIVDKVIPMKDRMDDTEFQTERTKLVESHKSKESGEISIQGISYPYRTIGDQMWMSSNLRVTRFNNGDAILFAETKEEWEKANQNGIPAWCWSGCGEKGVIIYNWFAVIDKRGIAPEGWHVPTLDDFKKLRELFSNDLIGGRILAHENWIDINGTNDLGFNAKPYCARGSIGGFAKSIEQKAGFWTSTEAETGLTAWYFNVNEKHGISIADYYWGNGFAIRLIKD